MGMGGGIGILERVVKYLDLWKTNYCESICQEHSLRSRTKVGGSKTIRYRRSLNYKLCQPGIGGRLLSTPSAPRGKPENSGSGGSMVARLKLKGIDGRAPPGVEPVA